MTETGRAINRVCMLYGVLPSDFMGKALPEYYFNLCFGITMLELSEQEMDGSGDDFGIAIASAVAAGVRGSR